MTMAMVEATEWVEDTATTVTEWAEVAMAEAMVTSRTAVMVRKAVSVLPSVEAVSAVAVAADSEVDVVETEEDSLGMNCRVDTCVGTYNFC